jgi:hypothetical protein
VVIVGKGLEQLEVPIRRQSDAGREELLSHRPALGFCEHPGGGSLAATTIRPVVPVLHDDCDALRPLI